MPETPKIDAHHHLWHYTPEEFDWLDGPLAMLRRDFLQADLFAAMQTAGIDGTVAVQARQTVEETRWLLDLAIGTPAIRGVVGWAPVVSPDLPAHLDTLRQLPGGGKLKGLRHVVQGEPDPDFILRADFNAGIQALQGSGLVYDLLIFERHLPQTIRFVDRHPHQVFVLDHIAKPRIAAGALKPWATHIADLARRPNVCCKLSGLVTEADPKAWSLAQLAPYLETVVAAFGPDRLLAASDWPVLLAGCGYAQWFQLLGDFFAEYSGSERAGIFGQNAIDIYRLEEPVKSTRPDTPDSKTVIAGVDAQGIS